jgi:hypothetical protein
MSTTRARVNWNLVLSNIAEAREELQRLERIVAGRGEGRRSLGAIEVGLGHAYHHLNFAWRARKLSPARYKMITDSEFNRLGRFPSDVWLPSLGRRRRR